MIGKKIHFMGIGGSGMSGVSLMAHEAGYVVSGCDINSDTPYIEKIKKLKIPVFSGHDAQHLDDVDILAVSPSVLFGEESDELKEGKKKGIVMTWQKFLGQELQKEKKVICIAGTHGKSTTTAMAALMFENAKLDPSVIIGATVKEWEANYRLGKSENFIVEADEFFDSFLNYDPDVIIINNIEFDHPDYFKSEDQMFESFEKFIEQLKGERVLIYNEDDIGIKRLFKLIGEEKLGKLKLYGYSIKDEKTILKDSVKLKVGGRHNIANALGVITLGKIFGISGNEIKTSLEKYDGIGRRMELIGEKNGIKIYDDYAHHPTAIKVTLSALRQKYPKGRILVVVEPHMFSRTKALLPLYKNVFREADKVIIAPIFRSRDSEDFGVDGESIVQVSGHIDIKYINDFGKIIDEVSSKVKEDDIVIVMGAGDSYKLAKGIWEKVQEK